MRLQCWRTALLKIPTRVYSSVYWRRFMCWEHSHQYMRENTFAQCLNWSSSLVCRRLVYGLQINMREVLPAWQTKQSAGQKVGKDRKSARDSGHPKSQTITKERHVFNHRYWRVSLLLQQWDWEFLPSGLNCTVLLTPRASIWPQISTWYQLSGTVRRNSAGSWGCILGQRG